MKINETARITACLCLAAAAFCAPPYAARAQTAISNGVPTPVTVSAAMNNNFAVEATDVDFGTLMITSAAGETGELAMATDGTIDDSGNTDPVARLLSDAAAGQPGILGLTGGLPDTTVFIRYSNVVDLTCVSGCVGVNPDIVVARIVDDMPGQPGAWSVDDADPDGDAVAGEGVTDGAGAITINIGVTLRTENTNDRYQSGDYEGTFDVTLEY